MDDERTTSQADVALDVKLGRVTLGARLVLEGVNLCCSKGTHTAILGRNGAGKTTLLRAIVGLIATDGSVKVNGTELSRLAPLQRARLVAYVPQRSELQARLSVQDVVAQGRFAHRQGPLERFLTPTRVPRSSRLESAHDQAIEAALDMTDTASLRHRPYPELSGGEQRRVLLARALASEAPVIALDEPTTGLDISHALAFFEQLRVLTRLGRTVLTVLHHLNDAALWCDRAAVVHNGRLHYDGAPALPSAVVREVYDVDVVPAAAPGYQLHRGPRLEPAES
jgi:iron complex transport system ATP-binding protein